MIEHLSCNLICAKLQDTKLGTKYWVCLSKAQTAIDKRERGKERVERREGKRIRDREEIEKGGRGERRNGVL